MNHNLLIEMHLFDDIYYLGQVCICGIHELNNMFEITLDVVLTSQTQLVLPSHQGSYLHRMKLSPR